MADVTSGNAAGEGAGGAAGQVEASEFQKYLQQHPDFGKELMKIVVELYNQPTKQSQVQAQIQKMFDIEKKDASMADQLRQENYELSNEIFDMQDELLALEKEYEEIKEDDI